MKNSLKQYYVYHLIDPRSKEVFYVGKGQGNRISQHVKDAKKWVDGVKCDIIRSILDDGYKVIEKKVKKFELEEDAYTFEKKEIERIGLSNLANIAPGGGGITSEKYFERKEAREAARAIARIHRLYVNHDELFVRWCGITVDVSKERAMRMIQNGIKNVFEILGETAGMSEFRKNSLIIENSK